MLETIIKCQQPVYTFNNELKKICPEKMSKYNAVAVLFIFLLIGTIIYFSMKIQNKEEQDRYDSKSDFHKENSKRPEKFDKTGTIISIFMCAILMSIFSFFLTKFGYKSSILKYETLFNLYTSDKYNMTPEEARIRIEEDYIRIRRDTAISQSGSRSSSNDSGGISFKF